MNTEYHIGNTASHNIIVKHAPLKYTESETKRIGGKQRGLAGNPERWENLVIEESVSVLSEEAMF